MADPEHLAILGRGVDAWNEWRKANHRVSPNLAGVDFWNDLMTNAEWLRNFKIAEDRYEEAPDHHIVAGISRTEERDRVATDAHKRAATFEGGALTTSESWTAEDSPEDDPYLDVSDDEGGVREEVLTFTSKTGPVRLAGVYRFGATLDLSGINLSEANLRDADFAHACLRGADLRWARLSAANLYRVDLKDARLSEADLRTANLWKADLSGAQINGAILSEAQMVETALLEANLRDARLDGAVLRHADLSGAHLSGAKLNRADMRAASLVGANLTEADMHQADLRDAHLEGAWMHGAYLNEADLRGTQLAGAIMQRADLSEADLTDAGLVNVDLTDATLSYANVSGADLTDADLRRAYLTGALLLKATVEGCRLSDAFVYGASVWDLIGVPDEQADLVVTPYDQPAVTVDDLKVAQFVYLLLSNPNIRDVIDTIGQKGVLILGRFGERKHVLDQLRLRLRALGFAPIVFDFEKPVTKDFTETVRTLAGMSAFVIADITRPRSVPQELQATIPDYMVPFVPILEEGEQPWSMFEDLWRKYEAWVFKPLAYASIDELLAKLGSAVVRPALLMRQELLTQRAKTMSTRSLQDFPLDED